MFSFFNQIQSSPLRREGDICTQVPKILPWVGLAGCRPRPLIPKMVPKKGSIAKAQKGINSESNIPNPI